MIWTPIALASVLLSWLATLLLARKLYCDWDLRVSSVRALFFLFFLYFWIYSTARAVFYTWLVTMPQSEFADVDPHHEDDLPRLSYGELDQLGIHAIVHLRDATNPWVVLMLLVGDAAHFGVSAWSVPLVYELSWLVRQSMDRGAAKERARTRVYAIAGHVVIVTFLIVDIVLALTTSGMGYTRANHNCLQFVYATQIASLTYMIVLLALLKLRGRKYETIHGEFVASPMYLRLQRIMLVYLVFALQFQVASLTLYGSRHPSPTRLTFISLGLALYNFTGLALAITTGCSQTCVLAYCGVCIPDDIEAQLVHGGPLQFATPLTTPFYDSSSCVGANGTLLGTGLDGAITIHAPSVDPVFVFTDIESSSALWGVDDGHVMRAATELHDSILRGLLTKYRGYEITTAGDAFQLAFHSIREASSYCLDAQLQLTLAKWPKALHGLVPATTRVRAGGTRRCIFNGLRVRMGIHDASRSEGTLVRDTHAVTGKTTYTGASEVIANEIGDLGAGGQILVTQRVAHWLQVNAAIMDIAYVVQRVGTHALPQVNVKLELFQLVPLLFAHRLTHFASASSRLRLPRTETLYSMLSDRRVSSGCEPRTPSPSPSPALLPRAATTTTARATWTSLPTTPPPPLLDTYEQDDSDDDDSSSSSDDSDNSGDAYTLVSSARSLRLQPAHKHQHKQRLP